MIDLAALAAIPDPPSLRTPGIDRAIADSVAYLASPAALASLATDVYWPKWDSPWWHMLLLTELGEAHRIPRPAAEAVVAGLDRLLHIFPIHPTDAPGADLHRDIACHCALGTMHRVLAATGLDVDRALPWVVPWFARYQMADGGLNCDETAYLQAAESPSSMVATVAPLEALVRVPDARDFVDRAARCLIERALVRGSSTVHNADEREAARAWPALTFPRFYFYDVLRGLAAIVTWAETTSSALPDEAIAVVVGELVARAPDGVLHVERRAYADKTTILPSVDRSPSPRAPAASFALLDAVGVIGEPSEALTRQWQTTRLALLRLARAGNVSAPR